MLSPQNSIVKSGQMLELHLIFSQFFRLYSTPLFFSLSFLQPLIPWIFPHLNNMAVDFFDHTHTLSSP